MLLTGHLILATKTNGQNIAINGTGNLPDTSAMLDISSTNKGLLAPRMTTVQQNAIQLPANGLLLFNTTDNEFKYNMGTPVAPVWSPLAVAPAVLVAASCTIAYTPAAAYAIVRYNSATVNTGGAYNTGTGIFTAPAAGTYQFIVSNMYSTSSASNNNIRARVSVNGTTDVETALSLTPYTGTIHGTLACNTIVQMTAGQTANISAGNGVNSITPVVGVAQHTLKIIRLD